MSTAVLLLLLQLSELQNREDLRFIHSAEQGYDSSCGLSALACLMTKYWNVPTDESTLAVELLSAKKKGNDHTVSFADLRTILKAKGFTVAAYKMSYDQLVKAASRYAPLLVHYDKPQGHFALVLAAGEDGLVVADPATGTGALGKGAFLARWSGNLLLAALPGGEPKRALIEEAVDLAKGRLALLERSTRIFEAGGFQ